MITLSGTVLNHSFNIFSGGSRISRRGGRGPRRGSVDSRGGYVSKILYVKTKELGPLGVGARPPPPRSANDIDV